MLSHLSFLTPSAMRISSLVFTQLAFSTGTLLAQSNNGTGTLTFPTGATILPTTYTVPVTTPPFHSVVFEPAATFNQGLRIDAPNVTVRSNPGSAIQPPSSTPFALRFNAPGGSLIADGMSLVSSFGSDGTLTFASPATATLSNSSITTTSQNTNAAAVRLMDGGSFSMTGGSLTFNPFSPTSGFLGYGFRSESGTTDLSLENVTLTGGTTPSHRCIGIDIVGGGSVTLKGSSTKVTARQAPALNLNGEFNVTSTAELTNLASDGSTDGTAVRLTGGPTSFTQSATGKIFGSTSTAALLVESSAPNSKIINAGRIEGVDSAIEASSPALFELTNSGEITSTGTFLPSISCAGGKITNQPSGSISGGFGLFSTFGSGSFDLTNAGSISGEAGVFSRSAGNFSIVNLPGAAIRGGTAPAADTKAVTLQFSSLGGSLSNAGLITANGGIIFDGGTPAADAPITLVNSGEITALRNSAIQIFGRSTTSFNRNISINNAPGGTINGGLVPPAFISVVLAVVHASNTGTSTIAIDNYGTIDARSRSIAIGVAITDSSAAVITLHEGSSTLGSIRGSMSGPSTSIIVAFSGNGSYNYNTAGISGFRKADPGTWTFTGERGGTSLTVSAGELILTNRTSDPGTFVNVSGGSLTINPSTPDPVGGFSLANYDADIGTGGRITISPAARAVFGGNAGVQRIHDGGLLVINGNAGFSSNPDFAATVSSNGRLAGTGEITGHVSFRSGGSFDPGNGSNGSAADFALVSDLFPSSLTFTQGGILRWSLASLSDQNQGTNSDLIVLNNLGSVSFETGAALDLDLSAVGGPPNASTNVHPFWNSNHSWSLVSGGTVSSPQNLRFAATGQATYPIASVGTFSLSPDGRSLIWTAIPVTDPFTPWINSFPAITNPLLKSKSADADGDGIDNLSEFALDGDPSNPTDSGKSRGIVSAFSGSRHFSLTLPIRSGTSFSGPGDLVSAPANSLIYRLQGTYNLSDFTSPDLIEVSPALDAGLPALSSPAWQYRTFRLAQPVSSQPRGFIRATIQSSP